MEINTSIIVKHVVKEEQIVADGRARRENDVQVNRSDSNDYFSVQINFLGKVVDVLISYVNHHLYRKNQR